MTEVKREQHSDSGCRNQKYYDKIRPAGGRLFRQSLCGAVPMAANTATPRYEAILPGTPNRGGHSWM